MRQVPVLVAGGWRVLRHLLANSMSKGADGVWTGTKFKAAGVKTETMKTPGGHEWTNWRLYLHELAPKLFR